MINHLLFGKRFTTGGVVLLILLYLCSTTTTTYAQTDAKSITVRGKVLSEDGEEVPGVTIRLKGQTKGTVTDNDGNYTIQVPEGNAILVFTYTGQAPLEQPVNNRSVVNVTMRRGVTDLSETVVVGYGSQKKIHLTGAVATVNVKDIQDLPLGNLSATLAGKLPGVDVGGGTARPGSAATITIRNPVIYSKDGGTLRPLYIIDDVIRSEDDFNLLDPSEVESISILKDAAAAVYGARSSQGAIVVRTKRGHAGKLQINYNSSVGFSKATRLPTMMTGYDLATYLNDLNTSAGKPATDPLIYTPDELAYFKDHNYDWLREAWKTSLTTRHTFNISGGTERATFFAGATYFYQNGNLDKIKNDRWTFRASADVKLAQGLKTSLSVSGDLANTKMFLLKQGGENPDNDLKGLIYTPQFNPPYVDGLPVLLSTANNIDAFHFFAVQALDNYNQSRNNSLNVVANLEYQPTFIKGLTAKVQYAKIMDNTFPKQFGTYYNLYSFTNLGEHKHIIGGDMIKSTRMKNGARVYFKPSFGDRYQLDGYLSYARKFGKHDISILAVAEQAEYRYDDVQAFTEDPTESAPDISRFAFGAMNVYESANETGNLSYIGRVNYGFADKYLLEFAFRYDASTNFAPEYRWGFFPSVSAGWVISEEGFFRRNVHALDFLKLRASAGHLGGDATKPWGYLQRYTPGQTDGAVFGKDDAKKSVGTHPEAMPNPAARWDDDLKFNAGIDAKALNNRLSATIDAFYDHRYNMLTSLTAAVPLTVGSAISAENYNSINAYGYEISLGWNDRIGKDINYYVNGYLSWSDAKAVKVDVDKGVIGTWEDPNGHSLDMGVRGYEYEGMFRTQADVDAFLAKNPDYTIMGKTPMPGMLYYKDIRGPKDQSTNQYAGPDGKIDENDQTFITNKANNHYGFGLSIGGGYKGFRLDMVMAGSFGGQSMVESGARKQATATSNRPAFWTDHWTPENTSAAYPDPYYRETYDLNSSFWFKSAFNFRMRTLNLSYTFPRPVTKNLGMESLRIYLTATNPFNFYNPFDYRDNALGSYDTYPNLKTFAFGVNVGL